METYAKSLKVIFNKYRVRFDTPEIDYEQLVDYMINEVRPKVSTNTWRTYRNAVCHNLGSGKLFDLLKKAQGLNSKKTMRKLANHSERAKEITPETMALIKEDLLNDSKSRLKKPLYHLLLTILNTGVRPSECGDMKLVDSSIVDGGYAVTIKRSKVKKELSGFLKVDSNEKGQSILMSRTIDLSHVSNDVIDSIQLTIQLYSHLLSVEKEKPGNYERFYKSLAQTMRICVTKCLSARSKYPTIYSARHQFASNVKASLKASGVPLKKRQEMVAVLMGQGSVNTSVYNYGLTAKGDEALVVCKPDENELDVARGHKDRVDD